MLAEQRVISVWGATERAQKRVHQTKLNFRVCLGKNHAHTHAHGVGSTAEGRQRGALGPWRRGLRLSTPYMTLGGT